ncbi:MAG TPA: peptidoglycan editing factor PgeF [Acidobacteriota bacterium]|nr:peptidoglycan editing factor PgeF [Acidobacteriota bacterium]
MQDDLDKPYLTDPRLERIPWLIHGFGTAAWTEADFGRVREWVGFRPVILDQVHSDIIHCVDALPDGRLEGDALITSAAKLFLVVKTADCLPVLVADETRRVVAAVHCGWRGTWKRILERVVDELRARYGCDPAALLAALGPCIGPECYEVGSEVRERFETARFPDGLFRPNPAAAGKYFLDLRAANALGLRRAGLRPENVLSVDACTRCRPELLSYRRDGTAEGRMYAFIGMKA